MADRFLWTELNTSDPDAAARFYGAVVGWDAQPFKDDRGYWILMHGGRGCGGMSVLRPSTQARGPHWAVYVHVADVDQEVASLRTAGGALLSGPDSLEDVGRIALVADPQGATYYAMTPSWRGEPPVPPAPGTPGQTGWYELHAKDRTAALGFYARYGWTASHGVDMGPMGTYEIFAVDGTDTGGVFDSPMPPQWLPYVNVADIEAARQAVHAHGGTVTMGPQAVPGDMFILQGHDPQGALFALVGPRPS